MAVTPVEIQSPLRWRPPTTDDVAAVTALFAADEMTLQGEVDTTQEDLASDWARPSFHLDTDGVCVLDGDVVVAYAEQFGGRAWVTVHPDHHGRGIGTALASWTERHAAERDFPQVGQTLSERAVAARELVRARGYTVRWDTWVFALDLTDPPTPPTPVDGVTIRPMRFADPAERRAVHAVVERAFGDWEDRDSAMLFEDWEAANLDRADVVPELLFVAEVDGDVVGAAMCLPYGHEGWVNQLAVAREHRGRGIAQALLGTAFGAFRDRGLTLAGLSTESRTGAKDLYLHVGMEITRSYARFTKLL